VDKTYTEEKLIKILKNPNVSKAHKLKAIDLLKMKNKHKDSYDKYIDMTPQELYKIHNK